MRFFHRVSLLHRLEDECRFDNGSAKFILLQGHEHTGKSTLISQYLRDNEAIAITVGYAPSKIQLQTISNHLKSLNIQNHFIPTFADWEEFFAFMLFLAKDRNICLVVDDFHIIEKIEPGILNRIHKLWLEKSSKTHLVVIGVTSNNFIKELEHQNKADNFKSIVDAVISIGELTFQEVCEIALQKNSSVNIDMLRGIYIMLGGLPRVYKFIDSERLWDSSLKNVLAKIIEKQISSLNGIIESVRGLLPEKGRNRYNSIVMAMAEGMDTVSSIGNRTGMPLTSVGKYLTTLEREKNLIKRIIPIGTIDPEKSKSGKYFFQTKFTEFWFCHLNKLIETGNGGYSVKERGNGENWLQGYIQKRYGSFVIELLNQPGGLELISEYGGNEEIESGPIWNRKASFDAAVYDRKKSLLKILHFNWQSSEDYRSVVSGLKMIRDHFDIKKAELHIFFKTQADYDACPKVPYSDVVKHVGFPDETLFCRIRENKITEENMIYEGVK